MISRANRIQVLMAVISALMLGGCGTVPPKNGATIDRIKTTLDEGAREHKAAPPVPPPEVSEALLPPLSMAPVMTAPAQHRFDISVTDADARDFFMGLVDGTSYNMVVHPDVAGEISLSLKNVTIQEVMETLRDVYGYEFEHTPGGYRVLPVRLQSRVFQVNYLNLKRKGQSHTRVSSGQVSEAQNGDEGDEGGNGAASTSGSDISTESESDFWKELRSALMALVGNANGRSVVVSPQSGLVVVRAMPAELREVENYLRTTDDALHRQVILEAKVIEVELKDGYQAGIDWAKIATHGDNSLSIGQSGGGGLFDNQGIANVPLPRGGVTDPQGVSPV
ncbi:MAG TPA: pilus (MSHA type) biogenesis protein MshL, partial [Chromatiales bacterium]|nr:pilus (MSHA type) biogenesis protein MshL [Chromatiales bacterium]